MIHALIIMAVGDFIPEKMKQPLLNELTIKKILSNAHQFHFENQSAVWSDVRAGLLFAIS